MKKEFIMRGTVNDFKTTGQVETLNFSGHKGKGIAYRLTEFRIWPVAGANTSDEMNASITAAKTAADPSVPNFTDEGLIGNACWVNSSSEQYGPQYASLVNDTYLITQNLLLTADDHQGSSAVNYHCRFTAVKMSGSEEAAANFKQFAISD